MARHSGKPSGSGSDSRDDKSRSEKVSTPAATAVTVAKPPTEEKAKLERTQDPKEEKESIPDPRFQVPELEFYGWVGLVVVIVALFIGVVLGTIGYLTTSTLAQVVIWISGILTAAVFIFGTWIVCATFQRWLADRFIFWGRVPASNAAVVLKDRSLWRIYVNPASPETRAAIQTISRLRGDNLVQFVEDGKIFWVGWPWKYVLREPWKEFTRDAFAPQDDIHRGNCMVRFLYLEERNIDLRAPRPGEDIGNKEFVESHFNVMPVDTLDPIPVVAQLIHSMYIVDPQRFLYGVSNGFEGISKLIAGAFQDVMNELRYFQETDEGRTSKKSDEPPQQLILTPGVQSDAAMLLNERLGLLRVERNGEGKPRTFPIVQKPNDNQTGWSIQPDESFTPGTPARRILDSYGAVLVDVTVKDLDPFNPKDRESLDAQSQARGEAAAAYQRAVGERRSMEQRAEGKKREAAAEREGQAQGLTALVKATSTPAGQMVLAADTAARVAENTDHLLIGDGGFAGVVGQLASTWRAVSKPMIADQSTKAPDTPVAEEQPPAT